MDIKWPPDYRAIFAERSDRAITIKNDLTLAVGAKGFYSSEPSKFINEWCITYDPRNTSRGLPTVMPFILFPRQEELVDFILYCLDNEQSGLIEKSRDMGATWLCCALSVWLWLFRPGISVGWGSRKEILVDRLGDPSSIFEKMKMIIEYLPAFFLPDKFSVKEHVAYMKIINPETGATITGEAGKNIGRGGRTAIFFKDEAAWYDYAKYIEASLGDNTNCQIDISSVHGTDTIFHRKRSSGETWKPGKIIPKTKTSVFVLDWRDHPLKTQEWYDTRKKKADNEGTLKLFAQEVDRDASAAVEGIVIPAIWVNAAIDAHKKLGFKAEGLTFAAQDVADEGADKHALAIRTGVVLRHIKDWGSGDAGQAAGKAIIQAKTMGVSNYSYDSVGVGSGAKTELNRLVREGVIDPKKIEINGWNGGAKVQRPAGNVIKGDNTSPKNIDFYLNLKAQAWWQLRMRFEKTYKAVVKGVKYDSSELVSILSTLDSLNDLKDEISQPTYTANGAGKIVIDKKPDGAKSPNLADAFVMVFCPIIKQKVFI